MKALKKSDPDAGFLKEESADWVPENFKKGRKEMRRRYFMEG
jgi:hypothetical protein